MERKKGSPAQERAICPKCGGKTLGNTYTARPINKPAYNYRQCHNRGCGHTEILAGRANPLATPRDNFPKNKVERAVYEHYLSGCERGDLYRYVKLGKAGLDGPDRSHSAAYAAWRAGKAMAE